MSSRLSPLTTTHVSCLLYYPVSDCTSDIKPDEEHQSEVGSNRPGANLVTSKFPPSHSLLISALSHPVLPPRWGFHKPPLGSCFGVLNPE